MVPFLTLISLRKDSTRVKYGVVFYKNKSDEPILYFSSDFELLYLGTKSNSRDTLCKFTEALFSVIQLFTVDIFYRDVTMLSCSAYVVHSSGNNIIGMKQF